MNYKRFWNEVILHDKVLDTVFWLSISIVIFWIIGKLMGWIHSPIWVQMLPFVGAVIAVITFFTRVGKILETVQYTSRGLRSLSRKVASIDKQVALNTHHLLSIDSKISTIEKQVSIIETRTLATDARVSVLEGKA